MKKIVTSCYFYYYIAVFHSKYCSGLLLIESKRDSFIDTTSISDKAGYHYKPI